MTSEKKTKAEAKTETTPKKRVVGKVISEKMNKTIVVVTEVQVKCEKLGKYTRRRSRFYAHDEANEAKLGDRVEIEETRPISKLKRWRLVRKLNG